MNEKQQQYALKLEELFNASFKTQNTLNTTQEAVKYALNSGEKLSEINIKSNPAFAENIRVILDKARFGQQSAQFNNVQSKQTSTELNNNQSEQVNDPKVRVRSDSAAYISIFTLLAVLIVIGIVVTIGLLVLT